ncbi:unnamed protein product [Danaus chrysippus]|uniref:(African queen) hypothetical protein n=1 Tax=Danaus chrysippus TaxID=151541 RepID=A0A8J2RA32_9NEOP|nr:unnamed protein product [Danaus chrysippus]
MRRRLRADCRLTPPRLSPSLPPRAPPSRPLGFTFARSRTRRDTSLIAAVAEPDLLSPVDITSCVMVPAARRRTGIK